MKKTKIVAVILAAGSGERTGFSRPKQLVRLAGQPVIAHTLECFQRHAKIDEIAIVTSPNCLSEIEGIVARNGVTKVKKILLGGLQRYNSSITAINAYEAESQSQEIKIIFHDAVRPLLSERIISDVIQALNHYKAVDVVIPSTDTVVVADIATETIREIPERRQMRLGQTPQAFAYATIKSAYELAMLDPAFQTTDDCGVVIKYLPAEKIYLVKGETTNLKLTFENDLLLLDKLMQCNASRRLAPSSSVEGLRKLRGKNLVIVGGTSGIGAAMASQGREFGAIVEVAGRSTGLDVSDDRQVDEYLTKIVRNWGRIDAIINSAAVLNKQPLMHMSAIEIAESIQTNLCGAINLARSGYKHLRVSKGHYLMFTSSSYTYGRAYYSLYSSTKAAIVNLMQALSDEWAEVAIKVNCVNPARTHTPMRTKAFGNEPVDTLLDARLVARKALATLVNDNTGHIYDIVGD